MPARTTSSQLLNPDTQGNPQQALIELKKMLEQEHVKYVFGPFLTNVYKGIAPYAQGNNGKFLMIGGATAIHFDLGKPNNDYLMRSWNWDAGPSGFGSLMVQNLKSRGAKKVAMLMQNDAFGHVARDIYAPLFKDAGIAFDEEWFEPGTTDFSSVLAKIAAGKPDYLFPGYTDAVLYDIVRQATEVGINKFWLVRGSLGPGAEEQGRHRRVRHLHPEIFRGSGKDASRRSRPSSPPTRPSTRPSSPTTRRRCARRPCYDHVLHAGRGDEEGRHSGRRRQGQAGADVDHL